MTVSIDKDVIMNTLYTSAITSAGSTAASWIGKKVLKTGLGVPMTPEGLVKLCGYCSRKHAYNLC